MRILYFYQYFSTPKGSWGTRVYEFAKRWVEQGHEVTVITSIYYKSDMQAKGWVSTYLYDGITVKVLNIHINNKQSIFKRIWTFIAYSILSSYYSLTLSADLVIASSGPITVGFPGLVAKYLKGRKLVFEVRDLWPDGAVEMQLLKNKYLIKAAYAFERLCYKASSKIVTLSPGMSDWIYKKHGFTHTLNIPNASDNKLFNCTAVDNSLLPEWAYNSHIAVYTGNIGQVNNSTLLLETANILQKRNQNDIKIVLIGDGQLRKYIEREAKIKNLKNFCLIGLIPKSDLAAWIKNAICSLAPLVNRPVLNTSSPNKIFDSFAAGTPVVQTTSGWIKDLLGKENCGLTVSPDNPEELADALIYLSKNPEVRKSMGMNAKRLANTYFDKNILANKMLQSLEEVVNNKG